MKKTLFSTISFFTLIPMILFAMIFPISLLSFSAISPASASDSFRVDPSHASTPFALIPSDGAHPVGDYMPQTIEQKSHRLSEIPCIVYTHDMLPDGVKKILPQDLSQNGNMLINDTTNSVDTEEFISAFAPLRIDSDEPTVLVLHTHATESFLPAKDCFRVNEDGAIAEYYDKNTETRTTDCSQNVVRLGELFCDVLSEYGIKSVHCQALHDYPDYNKSYSNSYKSVSEYLSKYPTIKYVIDLHRDSIVRENGEKLKPLCTISESNVAQIMTVIGSGSNHPNWRDNLSFALKYKQACDSAYPGFARPVYLRNRSFNQELSPGMIILEVGSCGNTLEEAELAAKYAAKVFAETIS